MFVVAVLHSAMSNTIEITPIILCGGSGSRLWPLSREDLPKQFLKLISHRSLFQETILRMQGERVGYFKFAKPIIATGVEHRFIVAEQLREIGVAADILLEPVRRDSAAAILAAANLCMNLSRQGLCMAVASDHAMPDTEAFHNHIELSLKAANDYIVLFGLQPQSPSSDYGYISPGSELPDAAPVHIVNKFAEKPTVEVARLYVAKGYLWNSSNFICKASLLLQEANLLAHDIAAPASRAAKNMKHSDDFYYLDEKEFSAAKSLSIDFAVLEKTTKAAVLPSNFPWSDLGTWKSIHAILGHDEDGNAAMGTVQFTHSDNVLVIGGDKLVAVEGLRDVLVAVTSDAILVAHLDTTAAMKPLVAKLQVNHPQVLKKPHA